MPDQAISTHDIKYRKTIPVLDTHMAYIDEGDGDPTIFLHGNPTSSYLWRNIIPSVSRGARCLAPDLIGMGHSGRSKNGSYRFGDHVAHLDAWMDALEISRNVTLVVHDWGSALGFHWAARHPDAVTRIVYMEAIVQTLKWEQWPEPMRPLFQALRSPAGEEMVLQNNVFVEGLLPGAVERTLTSEELEAYRAPYLEPGESRRPTLQWPREIPIDGEPADVVAIVENYSAWLAESATPKLFINADPGTILVGEQREFCRSWRNQEEITVPGMHYIQEDSASEIADAIIDFPRRA